MKLIILLAAIFPLTFLGIAAAVALAISILMLLLSFRDIERLAGLNGERKDVVSVILIFVSVMGIAVGAVWYPLFPVDDAAALQQDTGVFKLHHAPRRGIYFSSSENNGQYSFFLCELNERDSGYHFHQKQVTLHHYQHMVYQIDYGGQTVFPPTVANERANAFNHILLVFYIAIVIFMMDLLLFFYVCHLSTELDRRAKAAVAKRRR